MRLDMCFSAMPELETKRLLLRRILRSDARDLFAYAQDEAVARYELWDAHRTILDSRQYIRSQRRAYRLGEPCSWAVVLKETGTMVGTIGYVDYSPEHNVAEIGYSLARSCWNRGLMTEAVGALRDFSFRETGVHRLQAIVAVENPASIRVLEKCGFRQEGVMRGRISMHSEYVDVCVCGILREDWLNLRRN